MGKNILVGLSGGPSVAINASLAGVIKAAKNSEHYDKIYGAEHGIEGVLQGKLIDLLPYSDERSLQLLMQTPAMALGSCRKKLCNEDFPILEKIFLEYEIGAFFYIGGNDSMDTVLQLDRYFREKSDIKIIGVPKTIDNDLPVTDHTPGFGSSAKYLYHTMSEIIRDSEIYPVKNVVIVEVMGRDSGWLTLAAGLPQFLGGVFPQMIAIPEVPFDTDDFIEEIRERLQTERTVICAVSEGIRDREQNYIGMDAKSGKIDSFGHVYLSGVGKYLEARVTADIGCKVRSIELNVMQRCASHLASKCDLDEAFSIGQAAVRAAQAGESGITMIFERISNDPYQISISKTDVKNIANLAKDVPLEWHNLTAPNIKKEIVSYLLPLISGEIQPIRDETGLPLYLDIL